MTAVLEHQVGRNDQIDRTGQKVELPAELRLMLLSGFPSKSLLNLHGACGRFCGEGRPGAATFCQKGLHMTASLLWDLPVGWVAAAGRPVGIFGVGRLSETEAACCGAGGRAARG